jgi:hypothetical protein
MGADTPLISVKKAGQKVGKIAEGSKTADVTNLVCILSYQA